MVNSSLFTGLSGLQAHSRYIDVVGNNLANVSTPGFWGARTTFSDILNFTLSPGSGPSGMSTAGGSASPPGSACSSRPGVPTG